MNHLGVRGLHKDNFQTMNLLATVNHSPLAKFNDDLDARILLPYSQVGKPCVEATLLSEMLNTSRGITQIPPKEGAASGYTIRSGVGIALSGVDIKSVPLTSQTPRPVGSSLHLSDDHPHSCRRGLHRYTLQSREATMINMGSTSSHRMSFALELGRKIGRLRHQAS